MLKKISWVTCTYKRPQLLGRLIHCFLEQDYPQEDRFLMILDDADQYGHQQGDHWKIISLPQRFLTLGQKRNAAAALCPPDTEAYGIVDDDDMMLPHAMTACMAAVNEADLCIPSWVLQENTPGTFQRQPEADHHSSWAYRRALFDNLNGYRTINVGEDVDFRLRAAAIGARRKDPLQLGYQPYSLYSRHADSYHVHDFKTTAEWNQLSARESLGCLTVGPGYAINQQGMYVVQEPEQRYSTHVKALAAIAKQYDIRRAMEFGCGDNSTALFLNQKVFAKLELLTSLESNSGWGASILRESLNDRRLEMIVADEFSLAKVARNCVCTRPQYDLAFIDGETPFARVMSLLAIKDYCNIIVAHDTEKSYWDDVRELKDFNSFRFQQEQPNTTVYLRKGLDTAWIENLLA